MQHPIDADQAMKRKYPEQVVLVTTRGSDGRANVMAVGWAMIASGEPLMFALGIDDGAHTFKLINETRQFVVAFPNEGMAAAVLHVGTCHGADRDKIAEAGLAVQAPTKVKAPLLADAVANFECELVQVYTPGDCPLVVGKRFGEFDQLARPDLSYFWYVTLEEQSRLRGIRGISSWRRYRSYHLIYRTLPAVLHVVFVPGVGIVEYTYHHNGTPCDVRMRLKEFQKPN